MEYMILLYSDESQAPEFAPGTPEFEEMMGEWMGYNQMLVDGGHYIGGASLQGTDTATVLRKNPDGTSTTTDGPYAETKEQIGGYYLIEAKDLDEAMALAAKVPIPVGHFEVRPIGFRPDMG